MPSLSNKFEDSNSVKTLHRGFSAQAGKEREAVANYRAGLAFILSACITFLFGKRIGFELLFAPYYRDQSEQKTKGFDSFATRLIFAEITSDLTMSLGERITLKETQCDDNPVIEIIDNTNGETTKLKGMTLEQLKLKALLYLAANEIIEMDVDNPLFVKVGEFALSADTEEGQPVINISSRTDQKKCKLADGLTLNKLRLQAIIYLHAAALSKVEGIRDNTIFLNGLTLTETGKTIYCTDSVRMEKGAFNSSNCATPQYTYRRLKSAKEYKPLPLDIEPTEHEKLLITSAVEQYKQCFPEADTLYPYSEHQKTQSIQRENIEPEEKQRSCESLIDERTSMDKLRAIEKERLLKRKELLQKKRVPRENNGEASSRDTEKENENIFFEEDSEYLDAVREALPEINYVKTDLTPNSQIKKNEGKEYRQLPPISNGKEFVDFVVNSEEMQQGINLHILTRPIPIWWPTTITLEELKSLAVDEMKKRRHNQVDFGSDKSPISVSI